MYIIFKNMLFGLNKLSRVSQAVVLTCLGVGGYYTSTYVYTRYVGKPPKCPFMRGADAVGE